MKRDTHNPQATTSKPKDKQQRFKTVSLEQSIEKNIGKKGTPERNLFEFELTMEIFAQQIKELRKKQNLSQEELGKAVGVKKAQISKLEHAANSATIETIYKIFKALNAKVKFTIETEEELELA